MKKITLYLGIIVFLACQSSQQKEKKAVSKKKPNILIFLADDLGYGDLASYGNPIIKTPFIDQFAREGVRMTDCHSGGTVCSPSRAALLTGRNPYRSGFFYIAGRDTHLKQEEVTIAELLRGQGYQTSFWGKWHLSLLEKDKRSEPGPREQGFDYSFASSVNAFSGPENYNRFILNGENVGKVDGWYCDVIVDKAGDWLAEKRDTTKPFFMFVSTHEPHTPLAPPEAFSKQYENAEIDTLEEGIKYGLVDRPEKDISSNKSKYYGTVSQLDAAFGRLMKQLDDLALRENTFVFFTSDNGPETPVTYEESLGKWEDPIRDFCFGTPGNFRGMKRFPYEGGHRVPGIVRFPGTISAGSVSNILFNGSDLLPTIANLAGAQVPKDRPIDGSDAFNAFLGREVKRSKSPIWFYPNHEDTYFRMPQAALRSGEYTLVGHLPKKSTEQKLRAWISENDPVMFELYNLAKDPGQNENLYSDDLQVAVEMKEEMIRLWQEMRDEGLSGRVNKF